MKPTFAENSDKGPVLAIPDCCLSSSSVIGRTCGPVQCIAYRFSRDGHLAGREPVDQLHNKSPGPRYRTSTVSPSQPTLANARPSRSELSGLSRRPRRVKSAA